MIRKLLVAGVVAAATTLLSMPAADAGRSGKKVSEEIHQAYDVGKKPVLTVSNINGDVRITGTGGDRIEIDAVKYGSSQERMDELDVTITHKGDRVIIEVDYDDDDRQHNGGGAGVDFEIRVPKHTRLDEVELVNGDLDIEEMSGEIDASSVNGDVTCENLSGDVQLNAVNGDVMLTVGGEFDAIRLHSVNGTVELVVPKSANARLSASTVHGSIRGTGDIRAERGIVGSSLTSVLGKGEGRINLDTVNGNIRIYHEGERSSSKKD
jgi:DUF4097 and DUF4098 domain-containing protein YvlB